MIDRIIDDSINFIKSMPNSNDKRIDKIIKKSDDLTEVVKLLFAYEKELMDAEREAGYVKLGVKQTDDWSMI